MGAMSRLYWFVAAGTGGHIFPGIALAREIARRDPSAEFLFFGTKDRLEAKLVPQAGFPIRYLSAGAWKGRGLIGRVVGMARLAIGFFQALRLTFGAKPLCLVSVGGYVSAPTALACVVRGIPLYLVEPNIRAGLANRLLSRFARQAFTVPGGDAMELFACPVLDAGNPVREGLRPTEIRAEAKRVLVFGGSQGAAALVRESISIAKRLRFAERGLVLCLQTGEKNLETAERLKREAGLGTEVELKPFIDDVNATLAATDVVIARAGAMTVAELAVAGLPTIFVPFPHAADDHQRYNSRILESAGAAKLCDERDDGFSAKLESAVKELCLDEGHFERRRRLSEAFRRIGRPKAVETITELLLSKTGTPGR